MPDIPAAVLDAILIQHYRIPSITAYNRLEPSPRAPEFDRSLKAEVRDPLWMLTRQWQFGEFQGEDAASPITAQILGRHTDIDRVEFGAGAVSAYDSGLPLEVMVEREMLRPTLFLAVQMGRYFIKLLRARTLDAYLDRFISRYPLNYAIDDNDFEGLQLLRAVSGRMFDGFRLQTDIRTTDPGESQTRFATWLESSPNSDIPPAERAGLKDLTGPFSEWHIRSFSQPELPETTAWQPANLEYQFAAASGAGPGQMTLVGDQYFEGRIDWHSVDLDSSRTITLPSEPGPGGQTAENFVSFIPTPVSFSGMPHPRYWTMEENRTNFGRIDTSTTGLLHLLFAEFGLIFSNDWFILPYPLTINSLCEIDGLVVTDVFGQHVLVRPAGRGAGQGWQRWSLFHHTDRSNSGSQTSRFYLPPALHGIQEGEPLESVNFLRDEMANMVWAVEDVVPSQAGKGVSGKEMALREAASGPFTPAGEAQIRYVLGTQVPGNWIPFIPVHMPGSEAEIRLQRARLPGARGALGRVLTEATAPYFVFEEEVPRAGIVVERSFQRTRWLNGRTFLWIGRRKTAGTGEGWSNLKFDQIEPIAPAE